jgi:CheY-like chemotaxis protein
MLFTEQAIGEIVTPAFDVYTLPRVFASNCVSEPYYHQTTSLNTEENRSFIMPDEIDQSLTEVYQKAKVILIVEDDEDVGSFLVAAIQQETLYHPILVSDGFAALKTVHNMKPDLFILDYQLPHMNGIEVYDQLRSRQELADVPALLMTAGTGMPRHSLEKRKIVGLSKPLELSTFLKMIDDLLEYQPGQ